MDLEEVVATGNIKAVRKALAAGAKPDYASFSAAIDQDISILRLLVEHAKTLDLKDDSGDGLLLCIGMSIRSAYPNPERLRRAKDPDAPEPKVIVDLRAKAALLREAGAPVDFGAAAMLGYADEVERHLAKNPKLATKKVWDQSPSDLAAWAGAWETSRLIKAAQDGTSFDWSKLAAAVHKWALEALNAFGKQHKGKRFRRVAFDVDSGEAGVLLALDDESGTALRPGDYAHGEVANFEDHAMSEQLAGQLSRPDAAKTQRFLTALTEAASLLEKDKALTLGRSKDFAILVFEHDDDEAMARARSKAKRPKKK